MSDKSLSPVVGPVRLALLSGVLVMSGCSTIGSFFEGDKLDYKSASSKVPTLEVPPDLTKLPKDERFSMPAGRTTVTASAMAQPGAGRTASAVPLGSQVLPEFKTARIERLGNQRWLVVNLPADQAYPIVRDFWGDFGFQIKIDSPVTGIIETDWAENRAKIPQDAIRSVIGKVLDGAYDSGMRDKFRTRIERRPDGGSEITITHRGMIERVLPSPTQSGTVWDFRPSDPELEAEFTRRLLVRFGADEATAKATVAQTGSAPAPAATPVTARGRLVQAGGTSSIEIDDAFDRGWRQVGLALDRLGFTVEDRDRSQGLYFIRYIDPAKAGKDEPGFFSKFFGGSGSADANKYRLSVKADGNKTRVVVLNGEGAPDKSELGAKILSLLADELK
jgi:outer membrane protein assembly factor BamC